MLVTNKEEAKKALRTGVFIHGDRAIGKTEALMEVIHEDHQGNVILVAPTVLLGEVFKNRYRQKFPDDPIPKIENPRIAGRGESKPVYADVLALFSESERQDLMPVLKASIW